MILIVVIVLKHFEYYHFDYEHFENQHLTQIKIFFIVD